LRECVVRVGDLICGGDPSNTDRVVQSYDQSLIDRSNCSGGFALCVRSELLERVERTLESGLGYLVIKADWFSVQSLAPMTQRRSFESVPSNRAFFWPEAGFCELSVCNAITIS